jgi:hypothetical protein
VFKVREYCCLLGAASRKSTFMKNLFISGAWILSGAALYVALVGLEFCWNILAWEPVGSSTAWLLMALLAVLLMGFWFLARVPVNRVTRVVTLLVCVALASLAIYVLPEEVTKPGLFERPAPSPLWYRGGRAVLLFLPGVFWLIGFWRPRSPSAAQDAPSTTTAKASP